MSTLRSFTSFLVQVFAVVVVLVGIAILAQTVHPDTPSWRTVAEVGWAAFAVLVTALLWRNAKPVRYLFALVFAITNWLGGFWERLSYFVTAAGLIFSASYLAAFQTYHYWSDPVGWVYVGVSASIGLAVLLYGLFPGFTIVGEYEDGSVRSVKDMLSGASTYARLSLMD